MEVFGNGAKSDSGGMAKPMDLQSKENPVVCGRGSLKVGVGGGGRRSRRAPHLGGTTLRCISRQEG